MKRPLFPLFLWLILLLPLPRPAEAALRPAASAPPFTLSDTHGSVVEIRGAHGKRLLVLYFFDVESRSSLEGLEAMDLLARQHAGELAVFAISSSPAEAINRYLARRKLSMPVLRDTARVSDLYHARQVLPVGCVIDRNFKVVAYYQGGGGGLKRTVADCIGHELAVKKAPVARTAPPAGKKTRSSRRGVEKAAATEPVAARTPVGRGGPVPAKAPEAAQPAADHNTQRKVGKIINDSEW